MLHIIPVTRIKKGLLTTFNALLMKKQPRT